MRTDRIVEETRARWLFSHLNKPRFTQPASVWERAVSVSREYLARWPMRGLSQKFCTRKCPRDYRKNVSHDLLQHTSTRYRPRCYLRTLTRFPALLTGAHAPTCLACGKSIIKRSSSVTNAVIATAHPIYRNEARRKKFPKFNFRIRHALKANAVPARRTPRAEYAKPVAFAKLSARRTSALKYSLG